MIRFFNEDIVFTLGSKRKLRDWIVTCAMNRGLKTGEINFVFCSDSFLLELNNKYLKHNTLTDILTFPDGDNKDIIGGDIYISVLRVRENAVELGELFEDEIHRVMIHGVLHLCGFKDKTKLEKEEMRLMEDLCLASFTG